jgi:peptide-methionine (R)-S-oxide reductase
MDEHSKGGAGSGKAGGGNGGDEGADELRKRLTPIQFCVTQECATEPPFTGKYVHFKGQGVYRCVVCGEELFASQTKFDSGSGWPSFWRVRSQGAVAERRDASHGMVRTEVVCGRCGAHLGHVFDDGPQPTGKRYCINSASLDFAPDGTDGGAPDGA